MKPKNKNTIIFFILTFLFFLGSTNLCCNAVTPPPAVFTVVIDAGHGGKDAGAVGRISKEKNINLKVALAFGQLIESNCSDVKVIYTRKTDVFIPLDRRAEIANKAKADLFISIHTNALAGGKIARGAETYTLGMARAQANLDVAKRENSVILVENNYEERYQGFNPRSAESYIMFEVMQDKYMEQSVHLAKHIQHQFKTTASRPDKGVHQAGFLVLRNTSMPSVLVELGYISTPDEEAYLNTNRGIEQMSLSIYRAFLNYKKGQQPKSKTTVAPLPDSHPEPLVSNPATLEQTDNDTLEQTENPPREQSKKIATLKNKEHKTTPSEQPIFKVQLLSCKQPLKKGDKQFKGLSDVDFYIENNTYKYTCGASANYKDITQLRKKILPLFSNAFVVAFKDGKRVDLQEAIKEYKQNK